MIVATAGHVDHGKTSLVRLLTGVDTDRLEEERRRGLSITLGFAYCRSDSGHSIGFVDVPGHRRFLNNMIAGITGIDVGMLVVDANEGVMPQTREHLKVMRLLGVVEYVAVITKTDRVDPLRIGVVRDAIQDLLPGSRIVPVSNLTGEGKPELLAVLDEAAARCGQRVVRGRFRLSVDRAFVLNGPGLIVTGTAASGRIAVGDSLQLLTARSPKVGIRVRVRGLHVQGEPASSGAAGQRCALNLVGNVHWQAIARGDWLVEPGSTAPGLRFDARVRLLDDVPHPLRHLQTVKLYLGAARLRARAYFLDGKLAAQRRPDDAAPEGGHRLVQFILERELQVSWGDRFLLQNEGETSILGGGTVLGPNAPQRRKARPQRLQYLEAMTLGSPARILECLLLRHSQVVDFGELRQSLNLRDDEADALAANPSMAERTVRLRSKAGDWLLPRSRFDVTKAQLYRAVRQWHKQHPGDAGILVDSLVRLLGGSVPRSLYAAILDALVGERLLALVGGRVQCREHRSAASPELQGAWVRVRDLLAQAGFRIPLYSEIDRDLALDSTLRTTVIDIALRGGLVRRLGARRVALPDTLRLMAAEIASLADRRGSFTVIEAKAQLGLGRDLTIEVLEYFDSVRFTRRSGNSRSVMDRGLPERLFGVPGAQRSK